jgi:hypothetical protein
MRWEVNTAECRIDTVRVSHRHRHAQFPITTTLLFQPHLKRDGEVARSLSYCLATQRIVA